MKKLITVVAVFFIVLLIFRAGGFLTLFQIQQQLIKKEIKKQIIAGLPESELKIFKTHGDNEDFSLMGIKWIDEREFIFEGKMYDVVKVKNVNNEKWYYCYEDIRENALLAQLEKILNEFVNKPLEKNSTILLMQLLTTPFEIQSIRTTPKWIAKDFEPTHYLFGIKTWITSPAYPPPRF